MFELKHFESSKFDLFQENLILESLSWIKFVWLKKNSCLAVFKRYFCLIQTKCFLSVSFEIQCIICQRKNFVKEYNPNESDRNLFPNSFKRLFFLSLSLQIGWQSILFIPVRSDSSLQSAIIWVQIDLNRIFNLSVSEVGMIGLKIRSGSIRGWIDSDCKLGFDSLEIKAWVETESNKIWNVLNPNQFKSFRPRSCSDLFVLMPLNGSD